MIYHNLADHFISVNSLNSLPKKCRTNELCNDVAFFHSSHFLTSVKQIVGSVMLWYSAFPTLNLSLIRPSIITKCAIGVGIRDKIRSIF